MTRAATFMSGARAILCTGMIFALAGVAAAQGVQYDANCNKKDYTDDEKLQQEICSSHMGCKLVMLAEKACVVKDFLGNLSSTLTGRSTPDNTDVAYALSQSEIIQTSGVKSAVSKARSTVAQSRLPSYDRTNAAQVAWQPDFYGPPAAGAAKGYLNKGEGGFISWFEGTGGPGADGKLNGTGTQINSKGAVRSGTITAGQLSGDGLTRSADGGWTGGRFTQGTLDGEGFQTDRDEAGQNIVREGKFKDGKPDGLILTSWDNQTTRKELWKGGKLLAAGEKAPRGVVPKDPEYKSPEQIAAEKAAAEEAAFAAQLASEQNPGALYALGDEWAEKGDTAKAKATWRELIKRFPESPLAIKAADRLSGGGAASTSAPSSATTKSTTTRPAACTGSPAEAFAAFNSELEGFNARYPVQPQWGTRDLYKFSIFFGTESLKILETYRGCMSEADFNTNWNALNGARETGISGCRATSSDGGAGCVAEYP